ncbi:HK97 family phage prohead protease [Escherichia coli]|nr:HK97 family phage prohead protease [Escherichia coli]
MSRKSYPNVNAANQYARDVVRGKIVACQFVIQACQRHLDDLMAEKSKSFRYRFDKDLAERAAKFIQLLPHTKGEWAFKRMPITLEPWQLFVICCAFGWVNKGSRLRRFKEVYTEIPRKNGKSAISAGVALYCFACDNEFGAEVYSGATTEKQAWEVFRPARLMCKRTPMLTEAFGIEVNASNMNRPEDGARFEPLIGNPGDSGEFEGYGSVFGVKDSHDDVVMSGAFAASLRAWSDRKALPALLWQHRMDEPIGVYTEMKEDDVGLYVRGRLLIDDDPLAKRAHAHMKAGSLTGLSIGYVLKDWEYDRTKEAFLLKEIDLWEVSLVTFPSNDEARISDVKNALARGEIPEQKKIERVLRDVGLSRTQAKAFMAGGYGALSLRDAEDVSSALNALKNLNF